MLNTGLMAYLPKWLTPETIQNEAKSGQFFETFVVGEIVKSFHNQGQEPPIYFYRDTNQKEIDLLIEHRQMLYPVEIKATANPNKKWPPLSTCCATRCRQTNWASPTVRLSTSIRKKSGWRRIWLPCLRPMFEAA